MSRPICARAVIALEPLPLSATLASEFCQGPWNADLETPPGPEGSNGTLLRIRRGHPGILILKDKLRMMNDTGNLERRREFVIRRS